MWGSVLSCAATGRSVKRAWEILPFWWTTGRQRAEQIEEEAVLLWLRQDVYDGIPIHLR